MYRIPYFFHLLYVIGFFLLGFFAAESNNVHIQDLYSNESLFIYVISLFISYFSYEFGVYICKIKFKNKLLISNYQKTDEYTNFFTIATILHLALWKIYFLYNDISYVLFDENGSFYYSIITLNITIYYSVLIFNRLSHLRENASKHILVCVFIVALGMRIHTIPIIFLLLLTIFKSLNIKQLVFSLLFILALLLVGAFRFKDTDLSLITLFGEFVFPHTINSIFINNERDLNNVLDSSLICDIQGFFSPRLILINHCSGLQISDKFLEEYAPVGGLFIYPLTFLYFNNLSYLVLFLLFSLYGYLSYKIFIRNKIFRFELALFISFSLTLNRMGLLFSIKYFLIIYFYSIIHLIAFKGFNKCFQKI